MPEVATCRSVSDNWTHCKHNLYNVKHAHQILLTLSRWGGGGIISHTSTLGQNHKGSGVESPSPNYIGQE